jgi:hypothetical protein
MQQASMIIAQNLKFTASHRLYMAAISTSNRRLMRSQCARAGGIVGVPSRHFQSSDSDQPFAVKIDAYDTDRLLLRQKNFEKDPKNLQAAYEYLRELNRQGKYLTVRRLYQKHELSFRDNRAGSFVALIRE